MSIRSLFQNGMGEKVYIWFILYVYDYQISLKVVYFFLFKDNLKGYIRIKYIGMMCNGVGVILLRC